MRQSEITESNDRWALIIGNDLLEGICCAILSLVTC
jgi:hypothetical protein